MLLGLAACESEPPPDTGGKSGKLGQIAGRAPRVSAELVGGPLRFAGDEAESFRILVHVPPDHHGYLDRGRQGFLLPLSFSFADVEAAGARVEVVSRPKGARDEKVQATVLRGDGEFVFRLVETGAARFTREQPIGASLRYQICNDLTNTCYPPGEINVPLGTAGS